MVGDSFATSVADVVGVAVNVVGDSLTADVTDMVVVAVNVVGDSFATSVADMVVVIVYMVGDSLSTSVTKVVVVIVCMVGNGFPTNVTKVVMILIRVVGNGFTADVTLMVGIFVLMRTRVCTNGANAVLKLVVGFRNSYLTAAIPLLGMRCFGLFPDFLARVVFGVQFAVFLAADFADSFVFAGGNSAGAVLCFGIGAAVKGAVAGMSAVTVRYIITISMLGHFQGYGNIHCLSVFTDVVVILKACLLGVKDNDTGFRGICADVRINGDL